MHRHFELDCTSDRTSSQSRTLLLLGLCARPNTFNRSVMLSNEVRLITSVFFNRGEFEAALGWCASARKRMPASL